MNSLKHFLAFAIASLLYIMPVSAQVGEARSDLAIGINGGMNWSSVLLALCVSLAFWSCGNESIDKLKREVETINEDCPISLGSMGDLINMKYVTKIENFDLFITF